MAEKKEDTPFRRGLQFWRSESGEQGEGGGTRWRAAVLRAQSSTSSGSSNQEETPPDSDYHSDTDQPPVRKRKSGANDMHWGPINLRQFMKNWHLYVGLFEYQLRDLVRTGGWDPKTVSYTAQSQIRHLTHTPAHIRVETAQQALFEQLHLIFPGSFAFRFNPSVCPGCSHKSGWKSKKGDHGTVPHSLKYRQIVLQQGTTAGWPL